jgi:excinuclease UvrABC nuclease subunit
MRDQELLDLQEAYLQIYEKNNEDNLVLDYLLDEGYAETPEAAEAIMVNMSEDWKEDIIEAAKDQSNKQIEKGVKTTYKAGNVLDNQHQGRSRGLNRLSPTEREEKTKRMRERLKARRDDLFGERNRREDEARAELKKRLGL